MTKQTTATYAQKRKYYSTPQPTERATEYIKARKVYVKTAQV